MTTTAYRQQVLDGVASAVSATARAGGSGPDRPGRSEPRLAWKRCLQARLLPRQRRQQPSDATTVYTWSDVEQSESFRARFPTAGAGAATSDGDRRELEMVMRPARRGPTWDRFSTGFPPGKGTSVLFQSPEVHRHGREVLAVSARAYSCSFFKKVANFLPGHKRPPPCRALARQRGGRTRPSDEDPRDRARGTDRVLPEL
jgi:hypothetical protein